jgi:hypothetical protein
MSKPFARDDGRLPTWVVAVFSVVFQGMWFSYDVFFKKVFGDGERTQKLENDEEDTSWTTSHFQEKAIYYGIGQE